MSFLDTLGNLFGVSSGYDGGAATRATNNANAQDTEAFQNLDSQDNGLVNQANTLANTNYYGNAQQVYGQQQNASQMLQNAANGSVPSAAAIQQMVGQQSANAGLQSAALSQQGAMNPALAARNMLDAQAQAQQGIVASGTALRAQEQAVARQQYASQLAQMQQQQQQQGQLQYQQGQQGLQNINSLRNQQYQAATGIAQQQLANHYQQINGQAAANAAQAQQFGQTLSAIGAGVSGSGILPGSTGGAGAAAGAGADAGAGAAAGSSGAAGALAAMV